MTLGKYFGAAPYAYCNIYSVGAIDVSRTPQKLILMPNENQ
jgi:hypothetical protein